MKNPIDRLRYYDQALDVYTADGTPQVQRRDRLEDLKAWVRRNGLRTALGGIALIGMGAGIALHSGRPASRGAQEGGRRNVPALSANALRAEFQLAKPQLAPDGHSELVTGTSRQNPQDTELFLSIDEGKTFTHVADHVDAATWSPFVQDGNDPAFAVLRQNVGSQPDANGNVQPEIDELYLVNGAGQAHLAAHSEGEASHLQVNYGGKIGPQKMYSWTRDGQGVIEFDLYAAVGGTNANGSVWVGGMTDASLRAQLPGSGTQNVNQ